MDKINRIGIVGNITVGCTSELSKQAKTFLEGRGITVQLEKNLGTMMESPGVPQAEMEVDIIISIGGDGSLLRVLNDSKVPVFGINAGVLGFLTEIPMSLMEEGLERLLSGDFFVEERSRLAVHRDGKFIYDCVNEAVLHTDEVAKIRNFQVFIDKERAMVVRADGVIVATPTGSTCYALSAGGPILDPRVDAFVITPLAPFKLSARPIVVSNKSSVMIQSVNKPCTLVLDGRETEDLAPMEEIEFSLSEKKAKFVRLGQGFYNRIEEKLAT